MCILLKDVPRFLQIDQVLTSKNNSVPELFSKDSSLS